MPMQKPSRLLPDDSHHLMATDCVLPQVALWGKGMVCALKRTSGLNGWISNQKHISLQSVALREGSRGFEDNEACLVLPFSPKASAALSRRCLQNIIRLKEGIKEGNLKTEIEKLIATNKLPSYISDNLEIIRGFGNIAAHGMEDRASGEILDVEPNEAEFLLDVLELLFDLYFVQAAKAAKMKAALNQKLTSAGQKPIP